MPKKSTANKGLYVSIESHKQKINEILPYFGGEPKTVIQNVIDKYLPQYCEEQRAYHQNTSELLPRETLTTEKIASEDYSADMDSLFN